MRSNAHAPYDIHAASALYKHRHDKPMGVVEAWRQVSLIRIPADSFPCTESTTCISLPEDPTIAYQLRSHDFSRPITERHVIFKHPPRPTFPGHPTEATPRCAKRTSYHISTSRQTKSYSERPRNERIQFPTRRESAD